MQTLEQIKAAATGDYLLLIEPNQDLTDRIRNEKQYFFKQYGAPEAVRGKPHLTLINFVQYEGMEERICKLLRGKALEWAPFFIELSGFGSFPSHTIYMNVVTRSGLQSLVKSIRTDGQALMKTDKQNKAHFILSPHVTIARRLKPWQYEEGWKEYQNKDFSGKFMAREMTLLRRFGKNPYELVERFQFNGRGPRLSQQTSMF